MAKLTDAEIASVCGILGNIISFFVFLAPIPTFYRIYKEKSTQGFHVTPYAVALFSAVLLLYYGSLKPNGIMLITINSFGCAVESVYIILFLVFVTKQAKAFTMKLLGLLNIVGMGMLVLVTMLAVKGNKRITVVGWFTAIFSVCVFAAPLSVMRLVIKTKSVEFLPFALSFFLTLNAVVWFFYGFLIRDYYIATPNILGFTFGIAQMILYFMYKNNKKGNNEQVEATERIVVDMAKLDHNVNADSKV